LFFADALSERVDKGGGAPLKRVRRVSAESAVDLMAASSRLLKNALVFRLLG
jgi:hypothetical protein